MLMLCTVLAVTCRRCGVWRRTKIQLQRLSIKPGCRYTIGCPVPLEATCISSTSTVCGSEQRVAGISRCICHFQWFLCHFVREASRTAVSIIRLYSSHLQLPNYVKYSAGHLEESQNKNLGGLIPLIHVLWYLDKYVLAVGMLMQWLFWMTRLPCPQRLQRRTSRGGLKWRFSLCQRSSKKTEAVPRTPWLG